MRTSRFLLTVAFAVLNISALVFPVQAADPNYYNVEDDRVIPLGALAAGVTTVAKVGDDYVLKFVGDETIEYHIDTTHADFPIGVVRVTEASSGAILMRGGQRFRYAATPEGAGGNVWGARQVPGGTVVTPLADYVRNEFVVLDYQHEYSGVTHQVRYVITIEGKSLKVRSYSLTPENTAYGNNYFGFELGEHGNMSDPQFLSIAFMEQVPVTFFGGNWFFSNFCDMNNSRCGHRRYSESLTAPLKNYVFPYYYKMTDGSINHPVDDTVWLTVSSKIEDTFVDTDNYPISPHRVAANKAAVVRQSGDRGWANVEAGLRKKFNAGFFNSQQYFWNWQWNYININDPTMYPPNPDRGTTPEYNSMMDFMNSTGNTLGLYYTIELMDPGYTFDCNIWHGQGGANPSYDTTYLNRNSNGSPKNGWDTSVAPLNNTGGAPCKPNLGHPTNLTAINHQLPYLIREYKLMQENYTPQTLSYIDARHTIPGGLSMDQEAGTDKTSNMRDAMMAQKVFFQFQKALTGGPLLGEGSNTRQNKGVLEFSGYTDGVRHNLQPPDDRMDSDWIVMPDYHLKVINPKTLHHGMGNEAGFANYSAYLAGNQDPIRCAEICYGQGIYPHVNGDVPNDFIQDPDEIRAYYQITADLQPQFATAGVVDVGYLSGGSFVDLKQAIIDGVDFINPRLRIRYDNGLEIYANLAAANDWSQTIAGIPYTLNKDSWVCTNPNIGYLNFSAAPDSIGRRFDYVLCPGKYEMIDGRGTSTTYGGITATNLKLVFYNGYAVEETGTWPRDFTITGSELPDYEKADPADPTPLPEPNDASVNFRHLQGMYGWFYRAYDLATPMTIPGDRPFWAKFNRYPDLDYDKANGIYRYRMDSSVTVSADGMSPGDSVEAVRGWFAFAPGTVRIEGTAAMEAAGAGNGVDVRILDDFEGAELWSATIAGNDTVGAAHDLQIRVNNGDVLLFEADSKGDAAGDSIAWTPVITYLDSGSIRIATPDGSLAFGNQDCGAGPTAPRRVVIENAGAAALSFTGDEVSLGGSAAKQFRIVGDTGETSLEQGETRTVQVVFDPKTPGAKSARLGIETDDAIEPVVNVPASGTGTGESTSAANWREY